jgi:DNA-binding beta-propeller fold protein YncE
LSADGQRLYVAEETPEGRVHAIDLSATRARTTSFLVGHFPSALALSRDGRRLFVANRFLNEVAEFAVPGGQRVRAQAVGREPIALALAPGDDRLVVACHLPAGAATQETMAAEVQLLATQDLRLRQRIELPNGSTSVRGLALAPDGSTAYVSHILARFQQPANRIERGWMNTNAVSAIDLRTARWQGTVLLDSVEAGAANPWGIACSADGRWLGVTHAGTHELSVIDRPGLQQAMAQDPGHRALDDLSFLRPLQRRLALPVQGPRAVALAGARLWVAGYFSDSLCAVELSPGPLGVSAPWRLSPALPPSEERKGEMAFHDASHCFQQWQSCSSCHPDARADALNWDLMNDGLGNPKNTKSMLMTHRSSPAMWLGVRQDAPAAVRAGFKYIQFAVVDEQLATAVDRYLDALAPVPSPHLVRGTLSPAAERGKKHFTAVGCAQCHLAPLYTDRQAYDLGTTSGQDRGKPVDTPSLVECWRTAPYLHDGSAATLREVLFARNPGHAHADLRLLRPEQVEELITFVLSL